MGFGMADQVTEREREEAFVLVVMAAKEPTSAARIAADGITR
jgi:hypothetical protein